MDESIRVLLVDDDPDFVSGVAERLEHDDGRFAVETTASAEEALDRHATCGFDCLVSEFDLPDASGLELLERVRADDPNRPFVLFAENGSEAVASRAITLGVTDYLRMEAPAAVGRLADRVDDVVSRRRSERRTDDGRVSDASIEPLGETESPADQPDRRLHHELDVVLDRMSDVFTALDTDWRITYLNEGGRRAIASNLEEDLSKEDLIGRHFWTVNAEFTEDEVAETRLYRSCHEAMERQEIVTHEKYYEARDLWVYTRVYPSETGVSIISSDITERKKKETELQRRIDQLEEYECQIERLEEFAGLVSHDLRNPLNVAQGRLDLARETGDLDHLEEVDRSLDRMAALVEDLLVLAREGGDVASPGPVDLAERVEASWNTVDTADASIEIDVDRTILADRSRLAQLFENLFRNAVEHGSTSPDSQARQDAAGARSGEPSVVVRTVPIDGGFAVEDDGPGIPPDERERVFEAGYSTAEDGTGFGLQIVRDVVEAHGWDATVAEGRDGGARFEFTGVDEE